MAVERRAEGPEIPTDAFRARAGSTLKIAGRCNYGSHPAGDGRTAQWSLCSGVWRGVPVSDRSGTGEETCRPSH